MLSFVTGISVCNAAEKDQMPWWVTDILNNAEQTSQSPTFGAPPQKFTPVTAEGLLKELPDDRFIADRFPPTRLVFPDGTQEPEPKGPYVIVRVLKVVPLTGGEILQAYAKDVPLDPDAPTSIPAVQDSNLVDYPLLFDPRQVKEWSK
jgi:hypothetical protein